MMKSYLFIVLFFIHTCLFAQSSNSNLCRWHVSNNPELLYYQPLKNNTLSYCVTNDNENIYIDLRITDPKSQEMVLSKGLILWIDMEGKSLKKLGVRYPLGSQNQGSYYITGKSETGEKSEPDGSSDLKMANTIELIGFISEQERRFPSENPDNFRGSVKYDDDRSLHYKMVMPVAKLPVRNSKKGNGAMPFNLGIEYGFRKEADKPDIKLNLGRNSRALETQTGSELYWIKNVKLATSK